ncbi:Ferredoxin [Thermomonospora echinospora]|uniref:Ferredoxin n=1 Tax=Thermomonospora echinospora TaxID=1992 RepID=A0A1H6CLM9_9ACTN|nr:ferredoxin [Thermomonospora echinospora]SEG73575.1 Ferredoxin [Thermomonospora echinospora]
MKIVADHDRCRGAGQCVFSAPDLFDQSDEDGTVIVLDDHPPPESHARARRAARLCPNSVIRIIENPEPAHP